MTTETLLDTCRRLFDQGAEPLRYHDGHDGTQALRAGTTSGEIIVKRHRSPQKHLQEVHAYQHWTPSLGGHAPRLLASCDDPPTIITTVLLGQPLKDLSLRLEAELRAHRNAGELLAKYHQAAPARADLNMVEWLADRGEQWLAVARNVIPTSQQRTIRTHLHALAALGHIDAVPCHLDYTPGICWPPTMDRPASSTSNTPDTISPLATLSVSRYAFGPAARTFKTPSLPAMALSPNSTGPSLSTAATSTA
jgi:hypothetical protein